MRFSWLNIWRDYIRNSLEIKATKSPVKWIRTNVKRIFESNRRERPLSIVVRKNLETNRTNPNPELRQSALENKRQMCPTPRAPTPGCPVPGDPGTRTYIHTYMPSSNQSAFSHFRDPCGAHRCGFRSGLAVDHWSKAD